MGRTVGDTQRVGDRGALILILVIGGVIAVAGLDLPILDLMITWRSPAFDSVVTAYTNVAAGRGATAWPLPPA